jgi:Nicotinic acid phosphoribosyltransferase
MSRARVVGAEIGVTTDEQASWWGGSGIGTVPHALIAAYGGDTVLAAQKFAVWASPDMNVTVLVDFENDSVNTALAVADALGDRLWGVRLDTSESLVDRSLWQEMGDFEPTGVNERLVNKVRDALDERGHEGVRIVVSGGFTVEKIREFEAKRRPGRRLRRRLVADPRLERLHRRHRPHGRQAVGQVRPPPPRQLAARARHVVTDRSRTHPAGTWYRT